MTETKSPPAGKTIELAIEIAADSDAVWRAIAEADGLANWFPPEARVEGGVGGEIWISWGEDCAGTGEIAVWEPGRQLRWLEGSPDDERRVFVDFTIEARGGSTVVRLVNSGFDPSDDWADYVDLLESGWRYFLFNLKHYLERHAGSVRRMVSARLPHGGRPAEELWQQLVGEDGLVLAKAAAAEGDPVKLWSGDAGQVTMTARPRHFAARIPALNDALLLLELEPTHVGVWLSMYGVDESECRSLESALRARLSELLEGC